MLQVVVGQIWTDHGKVEAKIRRLFLVTNLKVRRRNSSNGISDILNYIWEDATDDQPIWHYKDCRNFVIILELKRQCAVGNEDSEKKKKIRAFL